MKLFQFSFSALVYLLFWSVFTYLLVFLGGPFLGLTALENHTGLASILKTVDGGPVLLAMPGIPPAVANALLVLAFGLQHSLMARTGFKTLIRRLVPLALERSVYVLATCAVLTWFYLAWQPIEQTIWSVSGAVSIVPIALFFAGAGLVVWSTFMISHGQLFGIAQAWYALRGRACPEEQFGTPALYKFSRHPMYLGILIVFWSTPAMTVGHFIAASLFTIYVFVGIGYEERDLLKAFGSAYEEYIKNVPQLFPVGYKAPGIGDD